MKKYLNRQKEQSKILQEIHMKHKKDHWMWYAFPQIIGLGGSYYSNFYAFKNETEVKEYMSNDTIMRDFIERCEAILELSEKELKYVFNLVDQQKLQSCMTLFNYYDPQNIYQEILEKHYDNKKCNTTLLIIGNNQNFCIEAVTSL